MPSGGIFHWANPVNGDFSTAADWNPNGGPPSVTDTAVLDASPGPYKVTLSASTAVNAIQGLNNATLDITGAGVTFTDSSGTNAGVWAGNIIVESRAAFEFGGTFDNTGLISLKASNFSADLIVMGAAQLTGGGAVTLNDSANNQIFGDTATDSLTNVDNTISGAGQLGAGFLILTNQAAGTIDATGAHALVLDTGANTVTNAGLLESTNPGSLGVVGGLQIDSVVANAGGTVEANGAHTHVDLAGGAINGGTLLTLAGGAINTVFGNSATLDSLTNDGLVNVVNSSSLTLTGAIDNNSAKGGQIVIGGINADTTLDIGAGGATLSGGGAVTLAGNNSHNIITGLTVGDALTNFDNTISGGGLLGDGQLTLINDAGGTIDGNLSSGLIISTGGGSVTNAGLIEASGPGSVTILNSTVNDQGGGTLLAAGAPVALSGAYIEGGTLNASGFGAFSTESATASTLDGSGGAVTNNAPINVVDNSSLTIVGSIVDNGAINVGGAGVGANLIIGQGGATLTGVGSVTLSDNAGNRVYGYGGNAYTLTNDVTISGAGQLGDGNLIIVNDSGNGVIDATGANNGLIINTGANQLYNSGVIEATGAAGLTIQDTTVNQLGVGHIEANNAPIYLNNADIIGGSLYSWGGGAINTVAGAGAGSTLDGTTYNGTIYNTAQINVVDASSLTIIGNINSYNGGQISLDAASGHADLIIGAGGATLTGGGAVTLSDNAGNRIYDQDGGADTLTNANTISGAGQLGNGAGADLIGTGSLTLNNQAGGTIDATGTNPLVIDTGANTITNDGTLEANGGTLMVDSAVSGAGSVLIVSGTADFTNASFNEAVDFTIGGGPGTLELANSHGYTATVTGFSNSGGSNFDTLDLRDISPATATTSYFGGTLTVSDGSHTAFINLGGADYSSTNFATATDGAGGTLVFINGQDPISNSDFYTTPVNQALTETAANGVLANDSDPNGLALTAFIPAGDGPSNGNVSFNSDGSFTYTPNGDFAGYDSFTYIAQDSFGQSSPTTVTILVTNGSPVSNPDTYKDGAGQTLTVNAAAGVLSNDTDPNGQTLSAYENSSPANGVLSFNSDGSFNYTPTAGFAGADTFTYVAYDNEGAGSPTTVTVNVTATAPTSVSDSYGDGANQVLKVAAASGVLANDTDNNGLPLTAALATQASHGVVAVAADGSFTYTPNSNFTGADSFTYVASDSLSKGAATTVNLTVTATPPTSVADTYGDGAGQALKVAAASGVLANDTDNNGLALTAAVATGPAHGSVTVNGDGSFTYTPTLGFAGADTFTYIASDSLSKGAATTVTVNVTTTAPTSVADTYGDGAGQTLKVAAASGVLANDTDNNGLALTAAVATGPAHGSVTVNADGSFSYTPTLGFAGADTFTYVASDTLSKGAATTVTVNVTAAAPTSVADSYGDATGQVLKVVAGKGLLANDTDNNGLPLTAALATGPTHGVVSVNPDGSFSYAPTAGYAGADSFTYIASDSLSKGAATTVNLTVTAAPPTSVADTYGDGAGQTLKVNSATGLLANDTDNNGLPLTAAVATAPTHGSVTVNSDGSFNYTPTLGFAGADTFTYVASDSLSKGAATTVTVNVTASAPTSLADSYGDGAGQTLKVAAASGVLANDTDNNGLALTAAVATAPTHGSVTVNSDGSFNYTPTLGFAGADSFTYIASDSLSKGAPTTVNLTVTATPPTSLTDTYGDGAGQTLKVAAASGVLANDTDNNGLALTAALATGPTHGAVTVNADGSFTYTPTLGYAGADSFTYIASDSLSKGAATTVNLTVTATPPTTSGDTYADGAGQTLKVAAASGVLADTTDNNGLALTAALATGPAHGAVTVNPDGSFTYTPTLGFAGVDSFTFVASDSLSKTAPTTVTLDVTAAAPTSTADIYNDPSNTTLTVAAAAGVLANDKDNNGLALTAAVSTGPAHGTVTLNSDGSFKYTPTTGFVGNDTFSYIASDSLSSGPVTTVTVDVAGSNGSPTSNPDAYGDGAGQTLKIAAATGVLANDSDPNSLPLTAVLDTGPAHGALTLNSDGSFSYAPTLGFAGVDTFTYIATDGTASGAPTTVTLTVTATAPTSVADTYKDGAGQTLKVAAASGVLANDTDNNGLALTAAVATGPAHGSVTVNADGSFTYTPTLGFAGADSFTYIASDSLSKGAATTVTVNVAATAPTSVADSYKDGAGQTLKVAAASGVLANDTDNNGLALTAAVATAPTHGAVTLNADGSFTYTPTLGYAGADSFTYIASDSLSKGAATTVSLTVTASPPTSVADSYKDGVGQTLKVAAASGLLANDTDNNGLPLTAAVATGPTHGAVTVNADGSFNYTPTKGFAGADTFTYIASDSLSKGAATTVTVNVAASPPTSVADTYKDGAGQILKVAAASGVLANDVDNNGLALTAAVATGPAHGAVTLNADGSFTYTPTLGFAGADTFTYIASDSLSKGAATTVTVNVAATAPTSVADSYKDGAGQTLKVAAASGVLANDKDNNGLALTAAVATAPAHGAVTLNADGSFTYTPTLGYAAADSFTYIASDSLSKGAATTVSLTVTASPPTSVADTYKDGAGQTLKVAAASGVLANDTDNNGLALTAAVATAPTHGTVTVNADGSFTYTPTLGYAGADSFTYIASDSLSKGAVTKVSLTVTATPPTSVADTYKDGVGQTLKVAAASGLLANDVDNNGLPLTAAVSTGPAHGAVTVNADGSFTYTPTVGFAGADTFTYVASDSLTKGAATTVTVNVAANPPTSVADTYKDGAGQTLKVAAASGVLANDVDNNGLALTAAVATGPAHGAVTLNADGSFTYTPTLGFAGADSFTYIASDSVSKGAATTVTVNVAATAPTSVADTYKDGAGQTLKVAAATGVLANDTDNNGLALTAAVATAPTHGAVTLNADGSFTYTPTLGYAGADSFTYVASDSLSKGAATTVNLTVTASPPTSVADSYNDGAGQTLKVAAASGLLANDTDNNGLALTAAVATGPTHGAVTVNADGSFTYTPTLGYAGADSFTYVASDSLSKGAATTVSLTVTATAPTSVADIYSDPVGKSLTVAAASGVLANDVDNNGLALTAAVATAPVHGAVTLNADGSFTYTPTLGFAGADTFTYIASDSLSKGAATTVTVNVAANAPTSLADSYKDGAGQTLKEAAASGVLANDTDNNGLALTAAVATGPAHGAVTLNADGSFTYTPTLGYAGADSFTYIASDTLSKGAATTVSLTVTATAPTSVADTYGDGAGQTLKVAAATGVLANDTDNNGLALTAAVATAPTHGAVTLNADGSFTYTPTLGYAGADSFTYVASDSLSKGAATTVNLTVTANAPTSVADTYGDGAGQTLKVAATTGVLANDVDNNGLALTAAVATGPAHGAVTLNADGSFTFTPTLGYAGADSFTYIASDSLSKGAATTVNLTVTAAPPTSVADTYGDGAGQTLKVNSATGLLANDTDNNGLPLTAAVATAPTHGSVTVNSDGSFNYTPTLGFAGADTFTYVASDSLSKGAATTVTVNVTASAPTSLADSYGDGAGQTLKVAAASGVLANDTDNNGLALTAAVATAPTHGSVTVNSDGSFNYTPTLGFAGADSFTYIASDSLSKGAPTTVNLTVTATPPTSLTDTYGDGAGQTLKVAAASGVLANDTDNNGLALTAALATGPTHGAVTVNADGSFTYTPTLGYAGADSFTYIASDSLSKGAATTVNLTVTATPPTTVADSYSDSVGQTLTVVAASGVLANDVDNNGLALTAALGTAPTHGAVTLGADGSFSYVPSAGFAGKDSFTYIASDSLSTGTPTTVTLNVVAAAPTSNPDSYSDSAGQVLAVTAAAGVLANDTDPNGLALTAALVSGASHGALTLNANGSFNYTPAAGFFGKDTFTYVASDGLASGSPTLVTLNVAAAPPITSPATYNAVDNQLLTVTAQNGVLSSDTDPNGLTMTAALAPHGGTTRGTLTLNSDGSFTYIIHTGFGGFTGTDSFTYIASDGFASSAPTKVTLDITNGAVAGAAIAGPAVAGTSTAAQGDPPAPTPVATASPTPTGFPLVDGASLAFASGANSIGEVGMAHLGLGAQGGAGSGASLPYTIGGETGMGVGMAFPSGEFTVSMDPAHALGAAVLSPLASSWHHVA